VTVVQVEAGLADGDDAGGARERGELVPLLGELRRVVRVQPCRRDDVVVARRELQCRS
jgi:hypothetical protein